MPVVAPYRFAPIHRWVHVPEWQALVSHDVPFKDGLSGEIEVQIEAMTPLLIGGPRREATPTTEGEVFPFLLPDGTLAIPPSTLQGMTRSILEIAAFGRLGDWIDETRVSYRDLGLSRTAEVYFKSRMTRRNGAGVILPQSQSGWLFKNGDGVKLRACQHARIEFSEIGGLTGLNPPATFANIQSRLNTLKEADNRYRALFPNVAALDIDLHVQGAIPHLHRGGQIAIQYSKAFAVNPALGHNITHTATIVLTGKTNHHAWTAANHAKHMEFAFHTPHRAAALAAGTGAAAGALWREVGNDVWRDFLEIHEKKPGRAANAAWQYWKAEFNNHHPIPVFFLYEGGQVTTLFMAFMGKTALNRSLRENLANSSPKHLEERPNRRFDLPSLIFGDAADDQPEAGLKRRASFGLARGELPPAPDNCILVSDSTVLLGPKPSYFPCYMRQPPTNTPGVLPNNSPHVVSGVPTYPIQGVNLSDAHLRPELAGVKLWPAPNNDACSFPELPPPPQVHNGQPENHHSTHVRLHALPRGTLFTTSLRFHNLRPMELGAIIWALTFGEAAALDGRLNDVRMRHRLGMGKPFGMGSVRIALGPARIRANAKDSPLLNATEPWNTTKLSKAFVEHMTAVYANAPHAPGSGWLASPQVQAVLKAANPAQNGVASPYMSVAGYMAVRNNNQFLPPYVSVGVNEFPKPQQ